MSGTSKKLTKKASVQQQKVKTGTVTQGKNDTLKKPAPSGKTMVIGRDALSVSVPREAVEKNITGAVKGFFGFRKKDRGAITGDKNENVPQPRIQDAAERVSALDLTDEERITVSEKYREKSWSELVLKVRTIVDSDEYKAVSEETREIFDRIMGLADKNLTETDRIRTEQKIMRDLSGLEGGRQIYKDPAILSRLYSLLKEKTSGGLDLTGINNIKDHTDDTYFEKPSEGLGFSSSDTVTKMPLFSSEPAVSDVTQGGIGDCYFLSAINAVLEKDPRLIKDCMKDEGDTVVVRFFARTKGDPRPVYVRVKKTIPVRRVTTRNDRGEDVTVTTRVGNCGALWVSIMEKAFAAVRYQVDPEAKRRDTGLFSKPPKGYDTLNQGTPGDAIEIITGIRMETKLLPRVKKERKYTDISALFSHVHYSEKEDFMRGRRADGTKRKASDWNKYKAEKIFGIKIEDGQNALMEAFRKNRVFDVYQDFLKDHLNNHFRSATNFSIWEMASKPAFRTMTDLNLFLDSVNISKMPKLNLGNGIDEDQVRKHYIDYFRNTIAASGLLVNGVNTTGRYSEEEKQIFQDLRSSSMDENGNRRMITAQAGIQDLTYNGKTAAAHFGSSGEAMIKGIAGTHAYTVLGTETRDVVIGEKTVTMNFVVIHNPWNNWKVRLYERDTMKPYQGPEGKESKGTFLMELSDFCNTFHTYEVEKTAVRETEKKNLTVSDALPDYTPAVDLTDDERSTQSVRKMKEQSAEIRELLERLKQDPDYASYSRITREVIDAYLLMIAEDTGIKQRSAIGAGLYTTLKEVKADMKALPDVKDVKEREEKYQELRNKYGEPDILFMLSSFTLPMLQGGLELTGKEKIIDSTQDEKYFRDTVDKNKELIIGNDPVTVVKEEIVTDAGYCDRTNSPLFSTDPTSEDVAQGDFGDCFMIAGLKAVVEKDPGLIRQAMKDEGRTVVVRFYEYNSRTPVYVRINKSVAYSKYTYTDGKGHTGLMAVPKGSKGALWVCLFEKAYAYARPHLNDPRYDGKDSEKGFNKISGGQSQYFLRTFLGKDYKETKLKANEYDNTDYVDFDYLANYIKESEKGKFMKRKNEDGSDRTSKDWNIFKAKRMFGIDIPRGNTRLYDMFRKNTILEGYNDFMKDHLKKNFLSSYRYDTEDPAFITTNDLDLFLDSIDLNEMPVFGLGSGIDETELKKHYIEYFRSSVKKNKILMNSICTDGVYDDREDEIYSEIAAATNGDQQSKKMVVAGIKKVPLMKRKKDAESTGLNGEGKIMGVVSKHAYMINGVTTRKVTIRGKTIMQRFVEVHNPWQSNYIRLYDKDTLRPFKRKSKTKDDGTEYDNKGIFLMELRDFTRMFQSYSIV